VGLGFGEGVGIGEPLLGSLRWASEGTGVRSRLDVAAALDTKWVGGGVMCNTGVTEGVGSWEE
jgi:hypothetical protein